MVIGPSGVRVITKSDDREAWVRFCNHRLRRPCNFFFLTVICIWLRCIHLFLTLSITLERFPIFRHHMCGRSKWILGSSHISNFAYCYGLNFFKTMILLLSGLRDFSVRFREIILESNRIQSANCHWWHFFPTVAYFGNQRQTNRGWVSKFQEYANCFD